MSEVSQRKMEQRKSSTSILFFMGITFIVFAFIFAIIALISSSDLNRITMTPILYYLTLAGLFLGMGSYFKEHNYDMRYFNNWMYSLILIGILGGLVVASIIWT